jgi:tetratricopeptide (TPR) repeat protein
VGALLAHRSSTRARPWLTWLLASVAIFTKESFLVLPVVLLADDVLVLRRDARAEQRTYALLAFTVVGYFVLRAVIGVPAVSLVAGTGVLALARSFLLLVVDYAARLVVPFRLDPMRPYVPLPAWGSVLAALGLAAVTVGLVRAHRARRAEHDREDEPLRVALFGWLWFLTALAPISLTAPNLHLVGDRYAYFPTMGLCVMGAALATAAVERIRSPRAGYVAGGVALIAALAQGARTVARVRDWHDEETLFHASLRADPDDFYALYFLGQLLAQRGQLADAEPLLLHSIAQAPDEFRTHNALCFVLLNENELVRAEAECRTSLRLYEANPRAWANLASVYVRGGQWDACANAASHAVRIKEAYAEGHYLRAVCLANLGRIPEAVTEEHIALALDPSHPGARSLAEQMRAKGLSP